MKINLISDIRSGATGVKLLQQSTEFINRFSPREIVDFFGIRTGARFHDLELQLDSFVVELDNSWILDGHRTFLYLNGEPQFFVDRVIDLVFGYPQRVFSTDRDTSVIYDEVSCSFLYSKKRSDPNVVALPGSVGIALSAEPSNWGSFLARILPKAVVLKNMGLERLLVYAPHENHKLMLEEAGWSREALIQHEPYRQYRFEKGVFPSEPTNSLAIGALGICALQSITKKIRQRNRLLYVTRHVGVSTANKRYAVNTDEIEKTLSGLGFEIVLPEKLTAVDQINLFAQAKMVVGPSGAGMFNAVFCAPGTVFIDIESETDWWYGHANLFSSLRLDYSFHCARPIIDPDFMPPHRPFEVDIPSLVAQIKRHTGS